MLVKSDLSESQRLSNCDMVTRVNLALKSKKSHFSAPHLKVKSAFYEVLPR